MSTEPSDMESLKARLKSTWMAGDFGLIAKSYESGAADFVYRLNLQPGMKVLDVACGTGNLAIPAAKTGATVTGVDIATNLLEQARVRAQAEGITATFEEGDAEQLPYPDARFDAVITMYGAMFAPRPRLAASELLRVCRSGGTIAMANWTRQGFVGRMFQIIADYVPPADMPSPIMWGDESIVRERFGDQATIRCTPRHITFRYPFDPGEVISHMSRYFGPMQKAFEALESNPDTQRALSADLKRLWTEHNRQSDGTTQVDSEYLEVYATRT